MSYAALAKTNTQQKILKKSLASLARNLSGARVPRRFAQKTYHASSHKKCSGPVSWCSLRQFAQKMFWAAPPAAGVHKKLCGE
jgi:hypothetical protein